MEGWTHAQSKVLLAEGDPKLTFTFGDRPKMEAMRSEGYATMVPSYTARRKEEGRKEGRKGAMSWNEMEVKEM
jgi:hypothetical protein